MRAVLEDLKSGEVRTCEVPQPELQALGILVRTHFSAVSAGTERASLEIAKKSLLGKALARPDLVKQVFDYARQNGFVAAYQKVHNRLGDLSAIGYSCAGVVLEVSDGVTEFRPGDRVACAGAGYANHCEINFVPRNLAVKVPESVPLDAASLTTIGAIAMQGLRQAEVSFGETVLVVGAGLVGVLTIQLAVAAGCRVVAIDVIPERAQHALALGAHHSFVADDPKLTEAIQEISRHGADAAIVTAATPSSQPLELSAQLLRDRGRIVVVGDVGMGVSRQNVYRKEISIVMSRSYGPGRYDPVYEKNGIDYPIGYVRWTEKRNMEAFLDLLARGALNVTPLLERKYPVEEAPRGYTDIRSGNAYTAILSYGDGTSPADLQEEPHTETKQPSRMGVLRIGCIGAGGFARSVILPILRKQKDLALYCVATRTGVSSESARRAFQFERARTPSDLLRDPQTDLVFVLSRHDTHARYVLEALAQQKSVFVEKPLAINHAQLAEVQRAYEGQAASGHTPFLMVGFNRRFAPFSQRIQECFVNRREAMLVHIRVNAGYLSLDHWTQTPANGSRIVGEACHFVDWARWLVGRPIERVWASALPDGDRYNRDNVSIVLQFQGGSIANILYLANGDKSVAKEYFEVFCEGTVARLEDFEILELVRNGKIQRAKAPRDKGHRRELELTLQALRAGGTSPIPFEEIKDVTLATLAIEESLARARPVFLGTQVESVEASQRSREQDSNSLDSSRDPEGNSGRSFAGSL